MKIWQLESVMDSEFEDLQLVNFEEDHFIFDRFDEPIPLADSWKEVEVYTLTKGEDSDLPQFWGEGFIPVFSEKALNVVHDLVKDQIEALPLAHPEKRFYAIHVLNVIDAIDYKRAVVEQLRSGLRIGFKKYAFIEEKVKNAHIFKVYLDNKVDLPVLVSDQFRNTVLSNGLSGFDFIEVWDSEKND